MPIVSVELWDADGLAVYGTGADRQGPPELLRLAVRPGFRTPGMTCAFTDLRLRIARTGTDLAWRLQRPVASLTVPDNVRSLYAPADGESRAVYLHNLPLDHDRVPAEVLGVLSRFPSRLEFECTVALVTRRGDGLDVSFRLRGEVGHRVRTDDTGYYSTSYGRNGIPPSFNDGPVFSVGLPEPE